jgi:hypothetical protein
MSKPRGREHSTLTETAAVVVHELKKLPGIKMIAPGEIRTSKRGAQTVYVTASFTTAGFELLINGQSSQRVSVHTDSTPETVFQQLQERKRLREFVFKSRVRKPGI